MWEHRLRPRALGRALSSSVRRLGAGPGSLPRSRGPGLTYFPVFATPILDLFLARGFQRTDAALEGRRASRSVVLTIAGLHEVGGQREHRLGGDGGLRRRSSDAGVDVPATRPTRTSAAPARPNVLVDTMKRPPGAREPHPRVFGCFSSRGALFLGHQRPIDGRQSPRSGCWE